MRTLPCISLVLLVFVTGLGCKRETDLASEQGAAPPPATSAAPGLCDQGGGVPGDPLTQAFFPRRIDDYCVDPHGETRAYGRDAKVGIDEVCLEQFNGECEVYKGYGLDRFVTLRYASGTGSAGEVSVGVARFASAEGAYGFFTRRVVAGQDPAAATVEPLAAGGAGALGTGIAYVWRGHHVAQLGYTNIDESPEEMAKSSKDILPTMATQIGSRMTGDLALPAAVQLLPTEQRLPLGITYEVRDAVGVSGAGPGAIGYYRAGDKRWRVLAMVRSDEAAAKDVLHTLRKVTGAKPVKDLPFPAVVVSLGGDTTHDKAAWLVGQQGRLLLGVGDEELALRDKSLDEMARISLAGAEKQAKLLALIAAAQRSAVAGGVMPPSPAGITSARDSSSPPRSSSSASQ